MSPIPRQEYGARIGDELKSGAFWRDCFAELFSTFFYVTAVSMLLQGTNTVQMGLGVTFVWAAVGYGLGDFGGAHLSSAVTMAMMIRAEITIIRAIVYWIMQAGGALSAMFFVFVMLPPGTPIPDSIKSHVLPSGLGPWQASVMELYVTLMLCLAYLGAQSINRKGYVILQSLPVGMAAGLGTFLAFPITGASMSPTQALARNIFQLVMVKNAPVDWSVHYVYWVGPMAGAILAAVLYWIFDSVDKKAFTPGVYGPYGTWSYNNYGGRPAKSTSREALTQPSDPGLYPQAY